jgi:hypothetical protein
MVFDLRQQKGGEIFFPKRQKRNPISLSLSRERGKKRERERERK